MNAARRKKLKEAVKIMLHAQELLEDALRAIVDYYEV